MSLDPPRRLSPSKVSAFTDCALAFRFSAIDHLPEPPSVWATKGTLVHRALELLFVEAPERRSLDVALGALARAGVELRDDPDFTGLALGVEAEREFFSDAETLVRNYFVLEDPTRVMPIGLELQLEAQVGGVTLRGIIDRLELDDRGELVVTDYKTGRAPSERFEQGRLGGVNFYALLCERLLGRRPATVQLLYLADPVAIVCRPTDRSAQAVERKVGAVWVAIERACQRDDFRPRPSGLCNYCAYKAFCPAFGGDPDEARRLAVQPTADSVTSLGAAVAIGR